VALICTATVAFVDYWGGGRGESTKTEPASSLRLVASKTPSGVQRRLLKSNELSGFTSGGVATYDTAAKWVSSPNDEQPAARAAAEKAMLIHEGFRAGAVEQLTDDTTGWQGLSLFEQLRSGAAARGALAYYVSNLKRPDVQATDGTYRSFKVTGIPGAVGYSLGGTAGGINIGFTDGDFYYLVGREGGTSHDMTGLQAAATDLYHRVHG
jgi:hypothetical protein